MDAEVWSVNDEVTQRHPKRERDQRAEKIFMFKFSLP